MDVLRGGQVRNASIVVLIRELWRDNVLEFEVLCKLGVNGDCGENKL